MVPVTTTAGRNGEARDDDIGSELADDADDIGEYLVAIPKVQRFLGGLGIPEVDGAGEELPAVVEAPGGEQLLRAGDPELLVEVAAELVLAAVAARQREVGRAITPAQREVGDELRVLVVGVGADVEYGAHGAEAAQVLRDGPSFAKAPAGGRLDCGEGGGGGRDGAEQHEAAAPGGEGHGGSAVYFLMV